MERVLVSAVVGGVVGAIAVVLWALLQPKRSCPDCGTHKQQAMWGGWTCPNCGCDIDRKGNKRTS